MKNEYKIIMALSVALILSIFYIFYVNANSGADTRVFAEKNRIAEQTIEDLRRNNESIIQAITSIGELSLELRNITSAYDELNSRRAEELRRREELEVVAGELTTAVGDEIQRAFDIISEGQRRLGDLEE